jgi:cytochrome c biogenesis protein CcmG/thiol:disulfide interchange protein DsbE
MSEVAVDQTTTEETARGPSRRLLVFGGALVVLLALLALLAGGLRRAGGGPEIGQPAPDFTLQLYGGGELTLSDLRGKVVLINFWASWCDPCRDEAPALERMWREYKDRGVVFIGVDYVDVESSARDYMAEFDITYPNGLDKGQRISRAYHIRGVPETFFIDKNGNIAPIMINGKPQDRKISPITEAELKSQLDHLLAQGEGG